MHEALTGPCCTVAVRCVLPSALRQVDMHLFADTLCYINARVMCRRVYMKGRKAFAPAARSLCTQQVQYRACS